MKEENPHDLTGGQTDYLRPRVTTKWDKAMTHFIGRPSIFGNPFPITSKVDRDTVIRQYEEWVRRQPEVLAAIKELPESAVLGCFCAPKPCHGDVIVKIWNELHYGRDA